MLLFICWLHHDIFIVITLKTYLKYSRIQMLLNWIKPTWIQKQYILRILAHVSEFNLSFKTVKCMVDWQVSSWSFAAVFEPYLHLYLVLTICDGLARDGF